MGGVGLASYGMEAIGLVEVGFGAADGFDAGGDDFERAIFVNVAVEAAVRGSESRLIVAVGGLEDGERRVGALIAEVERVVGLDAGRGDAFGGDVVACRQFEVCENGVEQRVCSRRLQISNCKLQIRTKDCFKWLVN